MISSADDFLAIPDGATAQYLLNADITLPNTYIPKTFAGTLKGGASLAVAKTITVNITGTSTNDYVNGSGTGLFSTLFGTGTIWYLKLAGTVVGTNLVGGFAGIMFESSTINSCVNQANITGGGFNAGGIAGAVQTTNTQIAIGSSQNYGTIKNDSFDSSWTGGITGHNLQPIYGCANLGNVYGNTSVGGITGSLYSNSSTAIRKCYNAARVLGNNFVGGIAGVVRYKASTIQSSYNSGRIMVTGLLRNGFAELSNIHAGGITSGGIKSSSGTGVTIKSCYNVGEVLGGLSANNLYSYPGNDANGNETASQTSITGGFQLKSVTNYFYPTSRSYVTLKTDSELKAAAIIGTEGLALSTTDFQTGTGTYLYPRTKSNLHDQSYPREAFVQTIPVENLTATPMDGSVVLNWSNKSNANHNMVAIYKDDALIARIMNNATTTYKVDSLINGTEYNFKVIAQLDYKRTSIASESGGADDVSIKATPVDMLLPINTDVEITNLSKVVDTNVVVNFDIKSIIPQTVNVYLVKYVLVGGVKKVAAIDVDTQTFVGNDTQSVSLTLANEDNCLINLLAFNNLSLTPILFVENIK